jgi:hypothetical protein
MQEEFIRQYKYIEDLLQVSQQTFSVGCFPDPSSLSQMQADRLYGTAPSSTYGIGT